MTAEHDDPRQAPEGATNTELDPDDSSRAPQESLTHRAFFEYWNQMDMLSWMGARITHSADGRATVYFEPDSHHRGAGVGGRAVTGAVQAYIFDIVTGAAVASLAQGRKPQVTVKLDVTFEYPAYEAPLTFEAQVLGGGKQILFVEGICHDVNGRVCSRANAIYRRFDHRVEVPESMKKPTPGNGEG
jgi:acyl-coenzyme A thioesterase PaaI-like protein